MKGPLGYGRYNDDPTAIGCPRAQSDMTPCIARDGVTAQSRGCVGCSAYPSSLLREIFDEVPGIAERVVRDPGERDSDYLVRLVTAITEP